MVLGRSVDPTDRVVSPAWKRCVRLAEGGDQQIYDWNGVRQGNANGQHWALIPDGKDATGTLTNAVYSGLQGVTPAAAIPAQTTALPPRLFLPLVTR